MNAAALLLSLTALADPLADVQTWRHLPDEKTCEANYNLACEFIWATKSERDVLASIAPWKSAQLDDWYWHTIREAHFCKAYWEGVWWVRSGDRYPWVTWKIRQEWYARTVNTERCAATELGAAYVGVIPAYPVWRLPRR